MKTRVAIAALLASACGGHHDASHAPSIPAPLSVPSRSGRSLAIRVSFESGRLHVHVVATGSADEMRSWQLGQSAIDTLDVRDGSERALEVKRTGGHFDIAGSPGTGTVIVDYDVVPDVNATIDPEAPVSPNEEARATMIGPARFRGVGDGILALPVAFESKAVDVTLDVHAKDASIATSFRIARDHVTREMKVSGATLRRAAFFAGPGGRAEFDAPEGHDEAGWLGYPAFDPRAVAAEVAGFRGLLHDYFKDFELLPATLLFTVDGRPRGHFRVMRTAAGVLATISGNDPYDAPLRLAVAHELVHAWIGEQIWMGDTSPGHEAESWWFHEGVARWVAREQLARAGLLSSDEYASEVNRVLAIVTTSRHGARSMKDLLVDRVVPGVLPLVVARGVLFATVQDARIREASKNTRSLDELIRALAKQAEEKRGPLPAGALRDLLTTELGGLPAHDDFDDVVSTGRRIRVPESALGACFESRDVAYDVYEPGFDVAASRGAHAVTGLVAKGPAALAGLHDGDMLVTADVPDRADQPAKVEIEREGKRTVITYKPSSGTRRGQAFRRKPGLTEEACRKLAIRH